MELQNVTPAQAAQQTGAGQAPSLTPAPSQIDAGKAPGQAQAASQAPAASEIAVGQAPAQAELQTIELTCIGCPMGCPLTVTLQGGTVTAVTGNTCPRGDAYARKEVTAPTRIVTTTVPVQGGTLAVVSVKTAGDIPKGKIFDCVKALKTVTVTAPVTIGQIIAPNIAATGVDVIATKAVPQK